MGLENETYTYRSCGTCGCELLNPDGQVIAWTVDSAWAGLIVGQACKKADFLAQPNAISIVVASGQSRETPLLTCCEGGAEAGNHTIYWKDKKMDQEERNRVLEEAASYQFPEEWDCKELDEHETELVDKVRTGAMSADEAIYRYCKACPIVPEAVITYAEERLGYSAYHAALKQIAAAFDGKDISSIIDYLYWFDT